MQIHRFKQEWPRYTSYHMFYFKEFLLYMYLYEKKSIGLKIKDTLEYSITD